MPHSKLICQRPCERTLDCGHKCAQLCGKECACGRPECRVAAVIAADAGNGRASQPRAANSAAPQRMSNHNPKTHILEEGAQARQTRPSRYNPPSTTPQPRASEVAPETRSMPVVIDNFCQVTIDKSGRRQVAGPSVTIEHQYSTTNCMDFDETRQI
jgi:hypothetical protein